MNINYLALSWSTSRGRDTYGYNIVRLDDRNNDKRYKCMGGGYDMAGTVFAQWLTDVYHVELLALARRIHGQPGMVATLPERIAIEGFYGATYEPYMNQVRLDGACGLEGMIRMAEALGLEVQREYVKKGRNRGNTIGWYVCPKEVA